MHVLSGGYCNACLKENLRVQYVLSWSLFFRDKSLDFGFCALEQRLQWHFGDWLQTSSAEKLPSYSWLGWSIYCLWDNFRHVWCYRQKPVTTSCLCPTHAQNESLWWILLALRISANCWYTVETHYYLVLLMPHTFLHLTRQSRARMVVENAFDRLKGRCIGIAIIEAEEAVASHVFANVWIIYYNFSQCNWQAPAESMQLTLGYINQERTYPYKPGI